MKISDVSGGFLDLLFPKRCAMCGGVIGFNAFCVCTEGLAFSSLGDDEHLTLEVTSEKKLVVRACYVYEEPISFAIMRFKEYAGTDVAQQLAELLWQNFLVCGLQNKYDYIVPVPMHKKALAERGFNQSEILAKQFSVLSGIKFEPKLLWKPKSTEHQRHLNREERLVNLKNAFDIVSGKEIEGKRILLIDDVVTTGSTLKECAKMLFMNGAETCEALCVAAT